MMLIKNYVGPSRIHGMGIFAAEHIKAGTQVWIMNHIIDQKITIEELATLPLAAQEYAHLRSFVTDDGDIILSRDNAVFFNHSDNPNCSFEVALRDIEVGEELTEDYRTFGRGMCNEFLFADANA